MFLWYKDIDFVVNQVDCEEMLQRVSSFCEKYKGRCEVRVLNDHKYRCCVRLELEGFLVLAFDMMYASKYLSNNYISESIYRRRKKDCYYIADTKDECLYRLIDYYENPRKDKHLNFVKRHLITEQKDVIA